MKIETTGIQRFMELVKRASQSRSQDIRMNLADALVLTAEIGLVMSRLAERGETTTATVAPTALDGGSFH